MAERPTSTCDQIRAWEEKGSESDPVAVYGTSVETINEVIKTGKILPFPREALHRNYRGLKHLEADDLLYYFTLIGPNVEKVSPDIYQQVCNRFPEHRKRDQIEHHISQEEAISSARFYALENGLSDYFRSETGIQTDGTTLLYIAQRLIENDLDNYYAEVGDKLAFSPDELQEQVEAKEVGLVEDKVSKEQLVKALKGGFKRRGVILFYNSSILNNRFVEFYEGEDELLIATKHPLKIDVISGIQILSDVDREALVRMNGKEQGLR